MEDNWKSLAYVAYDIIEKQFDGWVHFDCTNSLFDQMILIIVSEINFCKLFQAIPNFFPIFFMNFRLRYKTRGIF